jgi:hypothetical protein
MLGAAWGVEYLAYEVKGRRDCGFWKGLLVRQRLLVW